MKLNVYGRKIEILKVVIIILDQIEPILYAAKMAIGPRQLTEAETRNTARRAFQANPRLTASEIGRAIGRSRQAVDKYIADLRATAVSEQDLKVFKLHQLGIPQDRIAKRVGLGQQRISRYLLQMNGKQQQRPFFLHVGHLLCCCYTFLSF